MWGGEHAPFRVHLAVSIWSQCILVLWWATCSCPVGVMCSRMTPSMHDKEFPGAAWFVAPTAGCHHPSRKSPCITFACGVKPQLMHTWVVGSCVLKGRGNWHGFGGGATPRVRTTCKGFVRGMQGFCEGGMQEFCWPIKRPHWGNRHVFCFSTSAGVSRQGVCRAQTHPSHRPCGRQILALSSLWVLCLILGCCIGPQHGGCP